MIDNLDLNIDNYTFDELEQFLKISKNDDTYEIEKKINDSIVKINDNNYPNSVKVKLINFLNNAGLLVSNNRKVNVNNRNIIYKNNNNYINTVPTKTVAGDLNQIKRKNVVKTLSFNTLFRDDLISTPSTDCTFTLPLKIDNVVSVKLSSFEFPCSYYSISAYNKNNTFFIHEYTTNLSGTIIIPDGNYTTVNIIIVLTDLINTTLSSALRFDVTFNDINGKITITNTTNKFKIIFKTNEEAYKNFGWFLGYREEVYDDKTSYIGEAVCNLYYTEYIYFSLNEYSIYNCDYVIAIFKEKFIDNSLLAKIPIKVENFNILLNDNSDFISKERRYFGPVDYTKIHVKIYNQYGTIMNLNHNDFSFTLETEVIYDL